MGYFTILLLCIVNISHSKCEIFQDCLPTPIPIVAKIRFPIPSNPSNPLTASRCYMHFVFSRKQLSGGKICVMGGEPGDRQLGLPGPLVGFMPQSIRLVLAQNASFFLDPFLPARFLAASLVSLLFLACSAWRWSSQSRRPLPILADCSTWSRTWWRRDKMTFSSFFSWETARRGR